MVPFMCSCCCSYRCWRAIQKKKHVKARSVVYIWGVWCTWFYCWVLSTLLPLNNDLPKKFVKGNWLWDLLTMWENYVHRKQVTRILLWCQHLTYVASLTGVLHPLYSPSWPWAVLIMCFRMIIIKRRKNDWISIGHIFIYAELSLINRLLSIRGRTCDLWIDGSIRILVILRSIYVYRVNDKYFLRLKNQLLPMLRIHLSFTKS